MVSEPDSENGQAYATMRSLFDHTKRVYTVKHSFLQPSDLEITDPSQVDIIRKANLASFVSSIFGSQEIGFADLNEHFLDVFVPEGGRLLKVQGALYLELKTQAFIAAMHNKSLTRTQLLYNLFPDDMEQRLLARRPGTRQLAPSETDFVNRLTSRRDILLNEINNEEALNALPDKYHWEDFLRDLSSYISKNFDAINTQQVSLSLPLPQISCLKLVLMVARERNPSRAANLQAPMAMLMSHLTPPTKGSSLSLNKLRFQWTVTCMVTLSRVLPELPRLHSKGMAFDAPSNSRSRNSSINKRNRRPARPLYPSSSLKLSHSLLRSNRHRNSSSNNNNSRNNNSRNNNSRNNNSSSSTSNSTSSRHLSNNNPRPASTRALICTATPRHSNHSLPTNTIIALRHLGATNLSKLPP
jgi:hypothetical protein